MFGTALHKVIAAIKHAVDVLGGEAEGGGGERGKSLFSFAIRLPGFEKGLKTKSCSAFCRRDPDVM